MWLAVGVSADIPVSTFTMTLVQIGFYVFAVVTAGALGQTCEQDVHQCLRDAPAGGNDLCTNFVALLYCVSGKGEHCQLQESNGVTFQNLQKVAKTSCAAFAPFVSSQNPCPQLAACLVHNTQFFAMGHNISQVLSDTVRTDFWCSLMGGSLDCIISEADDCGFEESSISGVTEQRNEVNHVCEGTGGAGTVQGELLTMTLILSAATLLLQLNGA